MWRHTIIGLVVGLVAATLAGCVDPVGDGFGPRTAVGSPHWSPDGERIVFHLDGVDGKGEHHVVDTDGDGLERLRDLEGADWEAARRVLKVARDRDRTGFATLRKIGVSKVDREGLEPVFTVAWSPDNKRIAYEYRSTGRTDQDVYVVRTNGRSKPQLLARHASSPSWSSDGTLVAVGKGVNGIFVIPSRGGRPRLRIDVDQQIGLC